MRNMIENYITRRAVAYLGRRGHYARRCLRHSLMLGEAPLASHLLYTQPGVLNDKMPEQRRMGIDAGHAWKEKAEAFVVYTDRGITPGMQLAIERATVAGIPVLYRSIKQ